MELMMMVMVIMMVCLSVSVELGEGASEEELIYTKDTGQRGGQR